MESLRTNWERHTRQLKGQFTKKVLQVWYKDLKLFSIGATSPLVCTQSVNKERKTCKIVPCAYFRLYFNLDYFWALLGFKQNKRKSSGPHYKRRRMPYLKINIWVALHLYSCKKIMFGNHTYTVYISKVYTLYSYSKNFIGIRFFFLWWSRIS